MFKIYSRRAPGLSPDTAFLSVALIVLGLIALPFGFGFAFGLPAAYLAGRHLVRDWLLRGRGTAASRSIAAAAAIAGIAVALVGGWLFWPADLVAGGVSTLATVAGPDGHRYELVQLRNATADYSIRLIDHRPGQSSLVFPVGHASFRHWGASLDFTPAGELLIAGRGFSARYDPSAQQAHVGGSAVGATGGLDYASPDMAGQWNEAVAAVVVNPCPSRKCR